jgi:hypothetical protein
MKLPPLNRIVAFAGPYISLASGAAAGWLVLNVHALGQLGIQQSGVSSAITFGITTGLGALLPHIGQQKWLAGAQKYEQQLFGLVEQADPGLKQAVVAHLPAVGGDILAALTKALPPQPALPAALAPVSDASGDGSGDVEEPNDLIDVAAPPLDQVPAPSTFGDDAVHAPPPSPPAPGEAAPQ